MCEISFRLLCFLERLFFVSVSSVVCSCIAEFLVVFLDVPISEILPHCYFAFTLSVCDFSGLLYVKKVSF